MQNFPASVKRRIKALKQLQLVTTNIEAKFYEEVHALECKYYKMCAPLYEKRSEIVSGVHEPTDEQCVWESDDDEEGLTNDLKSKVKLEDDKEQKKEEYAYFTFIKHYIYFNVLFLLFFFNFVLFCNKHIQYLFHYFSYNISYNEKV